MPRRAPRREEEAGPARTTRCTYAGRGNARRPDKPSPAGALCPGLVKGRRALPLPLRSPRAARTNPRFASGRGVVVVGLDRHRARPWPIPRRTRGHRCLLARRSSSGWSGSSWPIWATFVYLCVPRVDPPIALLFLSCKQPDRAHSPPSYSITALAGSSGWPGASVSVRVFQSGVSSTPVQGEGHCEL